MTTVALASIRVIDNDPERNLAEMEKAARRAKAKGAALCCFGECVLQGFNCLTWEYEEDKKTGISADSPLFGQILAMSREIGIDLLFGFIEAAGDALYSSCALVEDGRLSLLYRRVSRGWKEFERTDGHYKEGRSVSVFDYHGRRCLLALCGDLWDSTDALFMDSGADLLLWPVYICYTPEEWETEAEAEYAQKAAEFAPRAFLVNSCADLNGEADAYGGSAVFENGRITASHPMGDPGILFAEL